MKRDDTLWKGILEDLFDDFLRFFYSEAETLIDMQQGFEFLDKELEDIFPIPEEEKIRYVDKLVKVFLKDGSNQWVLVHVEIQGQRDADFGERMFTYYYRIRDRYKKPITAIAILSDRSPGFNPEIFQESFLGTSVIYRFKTFKILNQKEQELKNGNNPFSLVILTALIALKKGRLSEESLLTLKLDLAKELLRKEMPKIKIRALMNFLRAYIRFDNKEHFLIFEKKLEAITGKNYTMGIEQLLLERAQKKGREEGLNQGLEEGREQGLEQGLELARSQVILNAKKKGINIEVIADLVGLSVEEVNGILKKNE